MINEDYPLLRAWIANDPYHDGVLWANDWQGVGAFAVCDDEGPTMFVKLVAEPPAMRMVIQFCPSPHRVARAILCHFDKVREIVMLTGARSIVFDSQSPRLIAFLRKAYGFSRVGESDDYRLFIQENK